MTMGDSSRSKKASSRELNAVLSKAKLESMTSRTGEPWRPARSSSVKSMSGTLGMKGSVYPIEGDNETCPSCLRYGGRVK